MPFSGLSAAFVARVNMASRGRAESMLETVSLRSDQVLIAAGQPIEHVHFLRSGFAAIACAKTDRQTAVALIGPESFTGHTILLGRERSPYRTIMQIGGTGWRMRVSDLKRLLDEEPVLRETMLAAVDDLIQQIAESAFAAAQLTVEARLARLLLLISDRVNADDLPLTHDRIALMLGCRRAGVTMSMHLLEGEHAVRATRGRIVLVDRDRLREIAGADPAGNRGVPLSPAAQTPARIRL